MTPEQLAEIRRGLTCGNPQDDVHTDVMSIRALLAHIDAQAEIIRMMDADAGVQRARIDAQAAHIERLQKMATRLSAGLAQHTEQRVRIEAAQAHIATLEARNAELERKIDALIDRASPRAAPGKKADRCSVCGETLSHRRTLRLDGASGEWRCERHGVEQEVRT